MNHTFPLLPFAGGNRVLSRPILFVHGLGEYYDTAWGVEPYISCTIDGVSVDPQQAASVTVAGRIRGVTNARYYQTTVSGGFGFQGACQENGLSKTWNTPSSKLTTLVLDPSFGDIAQQTAWELVWTAQPPVLLATSYDGQDLVGSVETWILEADAIRNMSGTGWDVVRVIPGTRLEYTGQGTSKIGIVRAEMKFRVKSLPGFWTHQAFVPNSRGIVGLVNPYDSRPYKSATAPDIIARIQRLKMGSDINKNGLYFFNGFRTLSNGKISQPLPWWNLAGPVFPNQPGESWTLYQALVQTLQMHYGDAWKTDASLQIDLVSHSRGGITIREMLANAGLVDPAGNSMPTGSANAANHIRTVVTSNAPHFGTYAATSWQSMPGEFENSLTKAVKDSAKFDMTLLDATVDQTYLASVLAGYVDGSRASEKVVGWFVDQQPDGGTAMILSAPIWAPITLSMDLYSSVKRLPADIRLRMTGNWFWPKSVLATWEYPWGSEKIQRSPVDLDYAYSFYFKSRAASGHLAVDSLGIKNLLLQYPKLPNGQDLDFQPLYSSTKGLGDLIRNLLATNLSGMCDLSSDLRNASCYGGFDGMRYHGWPAWLGANGAKVDLPIGTFWDDYTTGWFARSDALVQTESQQAIKEGTTWRPIQHPGKFHDPRAYSVRQFLTGGKFPDSLVPHGPLAFQFDTAILSRRFSGNSGDIIGASWLGHDIYCALAPDCRELLEKATGRVVRLPWDVAAKPAGVAPGQWNGARLQQTSIEVAGDLKYGLMSSDTGLTGFSLSATGSSSPVLRVFWSPGGGVVLEQAGTTRTLIPPGFVANPRIERTGNLVIIRAVSWSGKEYTFPITVTGLGTTATLGVLIPETSALRPLLMGSGTVDPEFLDPRPSKQARVWFRDARGSESQWTRPRILLENTGRVALHGAELRYRFRADPRRQVILEALDRGIWRIEPVAGDVYDLVASDPNAVVAPGALWPSKDQGVVALRFADWTPWDVFKDPSNDRNYGQLRLNETIRAFDGTGQLLWGREVGETDPDRPAIKQVRVATREAAVNEPNITKPEIQIKNEGNVPLQNLEIRWHIQLPIGAIPVADVYYLPKSTVSLLGLGNGRWVIRVFLKDWIQPGQTVSTGCFGVHMNPYLNWNRSLSPSNNGPDGQWNMNPWVEVLDPSGERLWGQARDIVVPPPPPPPLPGDKSSVAGLRVETYNESPNEKNVLKPRVRVTNSGTTGIEGFRLEFPVVPERNLVPVLDAYYVPNCNTSVETRATETVEVLDCRGLNLRGGTVWPDPVGGVFGMHYPDWSAWDATNDPAFVGIGTQFAPATGVRVLP